MKNSNSVEEVLTNNETREAGDAQRYLNLYGTDHRQKGNYDFVVDTTTITADVSATQDKSKTEFNKQISTMTIKRSADGTTFTDNIKSELEVIDKDTFNTLLKDDNFDTHPAIVKFKFENLRQKTLSLYK